jgi:hypothetical protein
MRDKDFIANLESELVENMLNGGKPELLFFILSMIKIILLRVVNGRFMAKFEKDPGTKKTLEVTLFIWLILQMLLAWYPY